MSDGRRKNYKLQSLICAVPEALRGLDEPPGLKTDALRPVVNAFARTSGAYLLANMPAIVAYTSYWIGRDQAFVWPPTEDHLIRGQLPRGVSSKTP